MKKRSWKNGLAAVMGLMLSIQAPIGILTPVLTSYAYTARAATVNASTLNVRSGPGTTYSQVIKLTKGTAVTVINETTGADGRLWYQIRFSGSGGAGTTGYALHTYIKFHVTYSHNSDFEAYLNAQGFPDSYKDGLRQLHAQYPNWVFVAQQTGLDWNTVIQNEGVLGRNLVHKNSISSHKSIMDGAYNWDTSSWSGFDGSTWVAASEDILRHYMDPRNFLDEVNVFQFLTHGYDSSIQTREGLQTLLKGSFMEQNASAGSGGSTGAGGNPSNTVTSGGPGVSGGGTTGTTGSAAPSSGQDQVSFEAPHASISKHDAAIVTSSYGPGVVGDGPGGNSSGSGNTPDAGGANMTGSVSYVDIIMNAAAQTGVNPYVIASMIIQEQGRNGQGKSISGNYGGYGGYYNYFNVGSYQSGNMSAVERGLWYASQAGSYGRPWDSPEKAIVGGAMFYGSNYTTAGQDTFYLKKYNVQGSNMYKHQYMTNVDGASAEGSIFAEAYSVSLKSTSLKFKIPVYSNMPASPCVKPTQDGSPNNKLRELGVEGFALTPTFNKDTASYDLIVDHSVSSVSVYGNSIDSTASLNGGGNIQLQGGNNDITITVKAQNGSERQYTIHVVRQNNGPTYNSGIGGNPSGGTGGGNPSGGPGTGGGPGASAPTGDTSNVVTPGGDNVIVISPAG